MNYGSILKNGQSYQFIISPAITGLSTHTGGSAGNELTISGTGFSTETNNITVTAANIPCKVTSATANSIKCTVAADPAGNTYGLLSTNSTSQVNGYVSGTGFSYARYDTSGMTIQTIDNFRSLVSTPNEQISQIPYDNQQTPTMIGELESPAIFG